MAHDPHATKIVLIEDEEILATLLTQKLEKAGYTVVLSQDGEEGYDKVVEIQPDLVLLDMMLPKMNGFAVLEKMSENGLLPGLPVIVISNSGQPVEIERAEKLGIRDYLVKLNFDPDEVITKMRAILDEVAESGTAPAATAAPEVAEPVAPEATASEVVDLRSAGNESTSTETETPAATPTPAAAEETESAEATPAAKPAPVSSGQRSVMIVEDDMFIADLLGRKLHEKFTVHQATDTKQAENILNNQQVDIICLDIMLPGEDGYSFLSRLKQMEAFNDIPVIILSNLGQQEEIDKGLAAGASDYLVKANMAPDEIMSRVEEVLESSRA